MKVVILAGGFGTRLQEYAKTIPKPMVKIVNKPILIHIMSHYAKYGFKDFIIASGYKKEVIKTVEVYGEMHRYIPVLAKWAGFSKITEKVVQHQERKYGVTKFGLDIL